MKTFFKKSIFKYEMTKFKPTFILYNKIKKNEYIGFKYDYYHKNLYNELFSFTLLENNNNKNKVEEINSNPKNENKEEFKKEDFKISKTNNLENKKEIVDQNENSNNNNIENKENEKGFFTTRNKKKEVDKEIENKDGFFSSRIIEKKKENNNQNDKEKGFFASRLENKKENNQIIFNNYNDIERKSINENFNNIIEIFELLNQYLPLYDCFNLNIMNEDENKINTLKENISLLLIDFNKYKNYHILGKNFIKIIFQEYLLNKYPNIGNEISEVEDKESLSENIISILIQQFEKISLKFNNLIKIKQPINNEQSAGIENYLINLHYRFIYYFSKYNNKNIRKYIFNLFKKYNKKDEIKIYDDKSNLILKNNNKKEYKYEIILEDILIHNFLQLITNPIQKFEEVNKNYLGNKKISLEFIENNKNNNDKENKYENNNDINKNIIDVIDNQISNLVKKKKKN
jgi:hypothetical protein